MEDIFRKKIRESIFLDTWIAQPKPKIDIEEMLVTKYKMIWIFGKEFVSLKNRNNKYPSWPHVGGLFQKLSQN